MTHFSPQNAESTLAIEHCVTLIPCHTLEDFPSYLEEPDARSLLAAWTAPWHPALIATTGRLPMWARADSLPEPLNGRAVFVSSACQSKLPKNFEAACDAQAGCRVIRGSSRTDFLQQCESFWPTLKLVDRSELQGDSRTVSPSDFYSLGYAWLQVQMMTRRLRYTSNLDEIFFASRVVEAAKHWESGDANASIATLHEAFDALAEERDHYFSNDPHLVDLTLLAASTLGSSLQEPLQVLRRPHATAVNFLIDCDLAAAIKQSSELPAKELLQLIDTEVVGVAGGGISKHSPVHHQTAASARRMVVSAKQETDNALGRRCEVFARAEGPTPGDLSGAVSSLGYIGAIPIDFAAGEGWSSESKLTWSSQSGSLDVLVAKPIDGSQSASFLSLAVRLGQAIDSGEIATALIVHWPGAESDAYQDLRAAASWGLAMGRFWRIDEYFRDGQRPYHHYRGHADDGAAQWLIMAVNAPSRSPLASAANAYRALISDQAAQSINALADLIKPVDRSVIAGSVQAVDSRRASVPHSLAELDENPRSLLPPNEAGEDAAKAFCERLSACPANPASKATPATQGCIIANPHSSATRIAVRMDAPPATHEFVYGASVGIDGKYDVTVDVPANGFVAIQPSTTAPRKRWFAGRSRIAKGTILANEFLQAEIAPKSGGIMGVYSGSARGNRYSLRLVHVDDDAPSDNRVTEMVARSTRITRSDESVGVIEADGILVDQATHAVADFTIRYSLSRGSRWLWVEADLKPAASTLLGANPWRSYFAFRSAVASEAATFFTPLRDKLHRTDNKRFDAPAGLLIDESPKQTLLFADGRPSHRRRGDRYIDSLMLVRGEALKPMRFAIGFDVPSSIDSLRSLIAPPVVITCDAMTKVAASGWLVHCSTADVVITDLQTESASPLVISFLVIATRGEPRKARLRFCRDIVRAEQETANAGTNAAASDIAPSNTVFESIAHTADAIELSLSGHEVVRVRVELVV